MKKIYKKPCAVFEKFELNASIATGCSDPVNLGPGLDDLYEKCSYYEEEGGFEIQLFDWKPGDHMPPTPSNFYPESCDCDYTAIETPMFTS